MGAVSYVKGYNIAGRKEIIHHQVNRNERTLRASRPISPQKPSPHREAGARIVITLERTNENGVKWQYYDGAHKTMPKSLVPDPSSFLPTFRNMTDIKYAAMKKYELYWMNRGREYNFIMPRIH